ncbi:MAG: hypothetical protein Q4F67_11155, partial [Propionibacteriaceae bacterium]|nr:hypothetical protein [Propionibacteriaceae bacterium]
GVLVVGLLWRQLTEYSVARGDSTRFPNSARVMLALANMTLVSLSLATFALSAGHTSAASPELFASVGDSHLGGALFTASILAGVLLALRGREGGELSPGSEVWHSSGAPGDYGRSNSAETRVSPAPKEES